MTCVAYLGGSLCEHYRVGDFRLFFDLPFLSPVFPTRFLLTFLCTPLMGQGTAMHFYLAFKETSAGQRRALRHQH